jgi:REP element-mobilizing transposase RayT
MSTKYRFHKPDAAYFISFATVNWVNLFTQEIYAQILIESINFCRKNKGMELFAYCIMPNHVHMIFQSLNNDAAGLMRDFKGFTSKKIIATIKENPLESRKEYLLNMFEAAGAKRSNVKKYQLWQHDNMPIELYSDKVIKQKFDYIHQNPVKAGLVFNAVDWKYSSASNYYGDNSVVEIDLIGAKD